MKSVAGLFFAVVVLCGSNTSFAVACPNEELWKNLQWCDDPSGKDALQTMGISHLHKAVQERNPAEVLAGYLQCQHHQAKSARLTEDLERAFGSGNEQIKSVSELTDKLHLIHGDSGQSLATLVGGLLSRKTGRPLLILKECSLAQFYKMAWYVSHSVDWNGNDEGAPNSGGGRGQDVYKLEDLDCGEFLSRAAPQWNTNASCNAILTDDWLASVK